MNTSTYRSVLRLIEKWPIDSTRLKRDFGEFIRQQIETAFNPSKGASVDLVAWEVIQISLNRIVSDRYTKLYPTSTNITTSTGLSADNCRELLSNEFIEALKEDEEASAIRRALRRMPWKN